MISNPDNPLLRNKVRHLANALDADIRIESHSPYAEAKDLQNQGKIE